MTNLKPVSKWLGFEYRNTKSSATQSMLWYRLWLETGDRQYLDDSVTYNDDDCRATLLIKGWLADRRYRSKLRALRILLDPKRFRGF